MTRWPPWRTLWWTPWGTSWGMSWGLSVSIALITADDIADISTSTSALVSFPPLWSMTLFFLLIFLWSWIHFTLIFNFLPVSVFFLSTHVSNVIPVDFTEISYNQVNILILNSEMKRLKHRYLLALSLNSFFSPFFFLPRDPMTDSTRLLLFLGLWSLWSWSFLISITILPSSPRLRELLLTLVSTSSWPRFLISSLWRNSVIILSGLYLSLIEADRTWLIKCVSFESNNVKFFSENFEISPSTKSDLSLSLILLSGLRSLKMITGVGCGGSINCRVSGSSAIYKLHKSEQELIDDHGLDNKDFNSSKSKPGHL